MTGSAHSTRTTVTTPTPSSDDNPRQPKYSKTEQKSAAVKSWNEIFKSQSSHSTNSREKTRMKSIRSKLQTVCLLCLQRKSANYSMVDNFPSSIKRHIRNNHMQDCDFSEGQFIRRKDHEEVKQYIETMRNFERPSTPSSAESALSFLSSVATSAPLSSSNNSRSTLAEVPVKNSSSDSQNQINIDQSPSSQDSPDPLTEATDLPSISTLTASTTAPFQSSIDRFTLASSSMPAPSSVEIVPNIQNLITAENMLQLINDVKIIKESVIKTKSCKSSDVIDASLESTIQNMVNHIKMANNIDEVLSAPGPFILTQALNKKVFRCDLCFKNLNKGLVIEHDLKKNTLQFGIIVDESFNYLKEGKNSKWYTFKARLISHLKPMDDTIPHIQQLKENSTIPSKLRSSAVTETHVKTAIDIIKEKGASLHFENRLAYLKSLKVDIGDIGHSR